MEISTVITALAALAQETRLAIFRRLVVAGSEGLPAGKIGEQLDLPLATLSFHLKTLQQAGLLTQKRQSRLRIYTVNFAVVNELIAYLTEHCCAGQMQQCFPEPTCTPEAETVMQLSTPKKES